MVIQPECGPQVWAKIRCCKSKDCAGRSTSERYVRLLARRCCSCASFGLVAWIYGFQAKDDISKLQAGCRLGARHFESFHSFRASFQIFQKDMCLACHCMFIAWVTWRRKVNPHGQNHRTAGGTETWGTCRSITAQSCGMRQALFQFVSHLCRTCTYHVTHVPHVPLLLPLKREASTPKNILQSKAGFKPMNTEKYIYNEYNDM